MLFFHNKLLVRYGEGLSSIPRLGWTFPSTMDCVLLSFELGRVSRMSCRCRLHEAHICLGRDVTNS